jgi:uncharacterized protein (UPF0333 family)
MSKMDVKGQISVEYLMIALVFLIIMTTVTVPLIGKSINASMDVSDTSDVSNAVNSIADAVGIVYANGPGSKRTVNVYFPGSGTLKVEDGSLKMPVTSVNVNGTNKIIDSAIPYSNVNIANSTVSKGNYLVTVSWQTSSTTIDISLTKV